MKPNSLGSDYFAALYSDDPDPWHFATSQYERGKYAATIGSLGSNKIGSVFEVGCSIGVLTRQLAQRCNSILAVDVAEQALAQARENCAGLSHARFARMQIPIEWPAEHFDLIVLSEVLYYFSADDIRTTARKTLSSLSPRGRVLLVHWTGDTDYPCTGNEAVELYLSACSEAPSSLLARRAREYRLDLLTRSD
jgi:cyclopropane fatty-acyl-phospholipid synthase-like methyltransferase